MARMYSRAKGKSGSKKPMRKAKPAWVRYSAKEIEMLIAKMRKEGNAPSKIGMMLRDIYGVPDVKMITGKKMGEIIKEKKLELNIPEDLKSLIKKSVMVRKHTEINKKDETAKRGLILTESKIHRLIKYYKKTKKLPADWKYEPEKATLYLE